MGRNEVDEKVINREETDREEMDREEIDLLIVVELFILWLT